MLFTHVHVSSSVRCILFSTVIQAREFLLKLLGAPPDMLLALIIPPGVPHLNILNKIVHELMPVVLTALNVHPGLRNTSTLLLFEVIVGLYGLDILRTNAKLGNIRNFERLKYLLGLLVALAPWALHNLLVELALFAIAALRFTMLPSFLTGLIRTVSLHQLRDELLADLRGALVRQNTAIGIKLVLVANHVGKVTVFHGLVQFQVLHSLLEELVVILEFHFIVHEKLVVFELVIHSFLENRELGDAINV